MEEVEVLDIAAGMQQVNFTCHKETITGQIIFIVGNIPEFGNWKEFKAKMKWGSGHHWNYTLIVKKGASFEYKYALLGNEGN